MRPVDIKWKHAPAMERRVSLASSMLIRRFFAASTTCFDRTLREPARPGFLAPLPLSSSLSLAALDIVIDAPPPHAGYSLHQAEKELAA